MTHYLRYDGKTIVDADLRPNNDFSVCVCIDVFGEFLLHHSNQKEIIKDFGDIQELRGLYWETNYHNRFTPDQFLEKQLKHYARKYALHYLTD